MTLGKATRDSRLDVAPRLANAFLGAAARLFMHYQLGAPVESITACATVPALKTGASGILS